MTTFDNSCFSGASGKARWGESQDKEKQKVHFVKQRNHFFPSARAVSVPFFTTTMKFVAFKCRNCSARAGKSNRQLCFLLLFAFLRELKGKENEITRE